ncbi:uncharacterized protein Z518_00006 [Rhinocladiella mackenziei CBS 650.93]|uniref:Uncharacterized protein n=1 Tax=Rhinocladiella mackenziei CBS 650.93 TaxID=1442369 RepID=A0A0D2HEC8_9EURO|nr:uncharacterized protein Z518_00006 [Rhinocladiella mackenziei CBS 650.93]KIX08928.1 hypothetical protein Z518_00006 [Rhinocladiella mackenziei CBS 650.93]
MALKLTKEPETESKNVIKDAIYLFDLLRESPLPILIHIGAYAAKTGAKPNTIVKRLGDIKKRNRLNIITTTQGDSKTTLRSNDDGKAKVKPKRETEAKPTKAEPNEGNVKLEDNDDGLDLGHGLNLGIGLPSPTDSTASSMDVGTGMVHKQMPQKRRFVDALKEEDKGDGMPAKKLKAEF